MGLVQTFGIYFLALTATAGYASVRSTDLSDEIVQNLSMELKKHYPQARIDVAGDIRWLGSREPQTAKSVHILSEGRNGTLTFRVNDGAGRFDGVTDYSIWIQAPVARAKIKPGTRLSGELFKIRDVDITRGLARTQRNIIVSPNADFYKFEAKRTILSGQFPLTSGVREVPPVRRGDSVRIRISSKAVQLTTSGIAQEAGYVNGQLRVMTIQTKKQVTGTLGPNRTVEVQL